jgi:nitronate monooxygenase
MQMGVDRFLQTLGLDVPIVQAPMAGVSTAEMAAAVSNAGGLGSIGVGSVDAATTRLMIQQVQAMTNRPINVNVFCHRPAVPDEVKEAAWLRRLQPEFTRYGATPPDQLAEIYQSFLVDHEKLAVLLGERPAVVSFHFGLPPADWIVALQALGIVLVATATNLIEGRKIAAAGIDAVVAQGYEAGGHRGVFEPEGLDAQLGTVALTRLLVKELDIPVIAAGGIMDGAGIASALHLGAAAAQLGTAFIACEESAADAAYRAALLGPAALHTMVTKAISGRPARCLANRFTALAASVDLEEVPDYPIAYDAAKRLHAAARAGGEFGYGAQWAGQGAPLARSLTTTELMKALRSEMQQSLTRRNVV